MPIAPRPDDPVSDPTGGSRARSSLFRARTTERQRPVAAGTDLLTGLPDRRALRPAFAEAARRVTDGSTAAFLLIDFRDFKNVNEMFGRDDGDLVLAEAARRIATRLGSAALLVRLGGDEFAAVAAVADPDQLDLLALGLVEVMRDPFVVRGYAVNVGINVGIALIEAGIEDDATAWKRADIALYRSKRLGTYRYEIYEHSVHAQVSPAIIVDWLRTALDQGHLQLQYQPIYAMGGEVVVAVEALLRWHHPVEGPLLPDVVLPALEDSGLIVEVGAWVIDEACRQARIWRDATPHGMPPIVFVNVSPRQLLSPAFLPTLERAIEDHEIDAGQICLELGGMSNVPDSSQAWMLLRECKALGVRLALDNFGSNESSYGLIRRLQLDYLKLDRHLTNARNATAHDDAITNSVVSLARSLGFTTIAQGVEDPASLERARSYGCDLAQGFYFGVAEPAEAIDQQISTGRTTSRTVFR